MMIILEKEKREDGMLRFLFQTRTQNQEEQ